MSVTAEITASLVAATEAAPAERRRVAMQRDHARGGPMAPDRRASLADDAGPSPSDYQEHQVPRGPHRLYVREYPGVEPTLVLLLFEWALAAAGGIRASQAAQIGGPMSLEPTAAAAVAVAETARNLFRREGEYWTVVFEGSVVRLKDIKGLRHLARLLAHPGREFHAVDLEAAEAPATPAAPLGARPSGGEPELAVRRNLGDAGALLDATAKAAYHARLTELRAELAEAEGGNDPVRAARARAEQDFLVAELARAVGLGGRDRRAASHAERARLNATRAIRAAMANLARANPALGRHLAATIRTGRYCAYTPDPRAPITWER
jgi:hypothetical protein